MAKFETEINAEALTVTTSIYPMQMAEFDSDEGCSFVEVECEGCGAVHKFESSDVPDEPYWCDACCFGTPDVEQDPPAPTAPTRAQVDGLAGFFENLRSGEPF